jgi:hypothetical protein
MLCNITFLQHLLPTWFVHSMIVYNLKEVAFSCPHWQAVLLGKILKLSFNLILIFYLVDVGSSCKYGIIQKLR